MLLISMIVVRGYLFPCLDVKENMSTMSFTIFVVAFSFIGVGCVVCYDRCIVIIKSSW